jgi:lysophospholipase L1-like esterase
MRRATLPLILSMAAAAALAQVNDFGPQSPAFAPVAEQPGLPRVLLIGDSISIGYTVTVRKELAGKANVLRIPENGADTANGVKKIDSWLGESKWDVIHFNWGLHDLKVTPEGSRQVPIDVYEKNLGALVARLKKTSAVLIWATTTPVPEGKQSPVREAADGPKYNAAARRVMEANGIAVDDLYMAALPRLQQIQLPLNVHFNAAGWEVLGRQAAASILAEVRRKP